jgi:D-alanyl-D-alanine carboxypeptidase
VSSPSPGATAVVATNPLASPTQSPGDEPTPRAGTGDDDDDADEGVAVDNGYRTLVDKQHGLDPSYVPPDLVGISSGNLAPGGGGSLRAEAAAELETMLAAAYGLGHDIRAASAYRSYSEQESTFAYWVGILGEEEAERVSARPGHSEHQLGLAVDLSTAEVGWGLVESLGDTAAGRWLADNAHEYGFALSYPAGGEAITGYAYEPWHFRYIGREAAADWKASGLTLNQYLAA